MIREQVPFDDLFPGDWITVWHRNKLGRVSTSSGSFKQFFFDGKHWYLQKTGRIWAIHTHTITCVDVRRINEEARR